MNGTSADVVEGRTDGSLLLGAYQRAATLSPVTTPVQSWP